MGELVVVGGLILAVVRTVFSGLARLREADAAKTWAGRADPMNPNVLLPDGRPRR
jgi:hypothetical protein